MKKLRLSYSLLAAWERGLIQNAVDTYFHLDKPVNEAMERGKRVHEEIAEHIKTYNSFPDWFFSYELMLPETEKEVIVEYNEMFNIKGVFDCLDSVTKTLFEFKTGTSSSLDWARTWQLPIYFLISELAEIEVEKALLIRHNKESDFVIVHNSKRLRDKAANIIDSLGPEMYQYFSDEGLL
jgi:hypothetical protein